MSVDYFHTWHHIFSIWRRSISVVVLFFSFPSEEDLDVDQFCASTGIGKPEQGHHRKASAPAAFGAGLFSSSAKMASCHNQTHLSTPDPGHSQRRYGPQNDGKIVHSNSTFSNTLITSFTTREVKCVRIHLKKLAIKVLLRASRGWSRASTPLGSERSHSWYTPFPIDH